MQDRIIKKLSHRKRKNIVHSLCCFRCAELFSDIFISKISVGIQVISKSREKILVASIHPASQDLNQGRKLKLPYTNDY